MSRVPSKRPPIMCAATSQLPGPDERSDCSRHVLRGELEAGETGDGERSADDALEGETSDVDFRALPAGFAGEKREAFPRDASRTQLRGVGGVLLECRKGSLQQEEAFTSMP